MTLKTRGLWIVLLACLFFFLLSTIVSANGPAQERPQPSLQDTFTIVSIPILAFFIFAVFGYRSSSKFLGAGQRLGFAIKRVNSYVLLNILAVSALFATAGFWWDGWWHVAMGRDSFFNPAHFIEYAHIAIVIIASSLLYLKTERKLYAAVFWAEMFTISMGIVDVVWHLFVPFEDLVTPLSIWSPPHFLAQIGSVLALGLLLYDWLLRYKKGDTVSFFRIVLVASAILGLINILVFPLQPFGWHNLLGFWGAGIAMFAVILYLLYLLHRLPQSGIATIAVLSLLVFFGFKAITPADIILLPDHAKPPHWLHFFALVPSIIWLDFINIKKYHSALLGGAAGFAVYAVYFLFWEFIQTSEFDHSRTEAVILVIASTLGGMAAGFVYDKISKRLSK